MGEGKHIWTRRRPVVGDRVRLTACGVVSGNKNEEGVVKSIDRFGWAHVLVDGYLDTSYVQIKRLRTAALTKGPSNG